MSRIPRHLVVLVLFCLAGCGGSAPPPEPQAPSGEAAAESVKSGDDYADEEEAEPATVEEAEAALQRAQLELQNALGPMAFAQPPPASTTAPAAQPAPAEAAGSAPRDLESQRAEKKAETSNCDLACRAFTSLSRAAQAVCRLDGDGGERCGRARKVVSDAEARLAGCSCSRP